MSPSRPPLRPFVSTYRLQLSPAFDLNAAANLLPYLDRLGVTVCYTSPYLVAGEGSASGYDVCDHGGFHPEFGGDAGFAVFRAARASCGLGHMIDLVPNHMGTDASRNRWWRDVLTYGRRSAYARYFDIDWQPVKAELHGKVLLPILGKQYGVALADGDIRLVHEDGEPMVAVDRHRLPLDPETVDDDLDPARLTPEALHALLERQAYRLAYWRTSADEINYRRFFDVDGLIGLRMEQPEVFGKSHALVAELIRDGTVTAIRVDHPDGLARPAEYFGRLRALAGRLPIVAEKILADDERLPDDWGIDGTTGYEFLNVVNGLFIDPRGGATLDRAYRRLTRQRTTFAGDAHDARRDIMATTMASEVQLLANQLNRLSERHPRSRDFTLNSLRRALVEIIANMTIYRTYLAPGAARAEDIAEIRRAVAAAQSLHRTLESSVFGFIEAVILGVATPFEGHSYPAVDDDDRAARQRFVERFQQLTCSVFAKAVEDTAFYRYQPLLSANEVGGGATRLGRSPQEFHAQNQARAAAAASGLLATATHDTKFGEDARARLNALSELPQEFLQAFRRWRQGARSRGTSGRGAIDMNDVYRLHQTLVATWPPDALTPQRPPDSTYVQRVTDGMRKAIREAKRHTSWLNPDEEYESRLTDLIRRTIQRLPATPTLDFVRRIARIGVVNSLAQLVLKLGSPGVSDIYQGAELWDLSLVDPDNRRPVDFQRRARLLDDLDDLLGRAAQRDDSAAEDVRRLLDAWPDGRIKFFVTAAGLRLRRRTTELFTRGIYEPLAGDAAGAAEVVAFRRGLGGQSVVVAVPRLVARIGADSGWPLGEDAWRGSALPVPADLHGVPFHSVLTGETIVVRAGALPIAELFRHCPVAILATALPQ